MSGVLTRELSAQLTIKLDMILRKSVTEVVHFFENIVRDYRTELVKKNEEVTQLRMKLKTAKLSRKKRFCGDEREDRAIKPPNQTSTPEAETDSSGQPSDLTKVDVEGPSVGKDAPSQSEAVDGLGRLKEEVTAQDGAPIEHKHAGPRSNQESVSVIASEENLSTGDQRQIDPMSAAQAKTKSIAHWDQNSRSADQRPLQDQSSSPFLSISQSGRCSPRPDPSLVQPASEDCISPLGDETPTRKQDVVSPNIQLRQLVVPIQRRSVQQVEILKVSSSKDIQKPNQSNEVRVAEQKRRPPLRCDLQRLLPGTAQESADSNNSEPPRKSKRHLKGEVKEQAKKRRKEKGKSALEHRSVKNDEKIYKCKTCAKVFDTKPDLKEHVQIHNQCKYCDKTFRFPSDLNRHKRPCRNKMARANPPKLPKPSCSETKTSSPSIKPFIIKLKRTHHTPNHYHFSTQGDTSTGKPRISFQEKMFSCEFCRKKFKYNYRLKTHVLKIHKLTQLDVTEDLAWTRPLEEMDGNTGD